MDVFGVTGNESHAKENLGWVDVVATDSYDFTIYAMLQAIFNVVDDAGMRFHGSGQRGRVPAAQRDLPGRASHQVNHRPEEVSGHHRQVRRQGHQRHPPLRPHSCVIISDYVSRNASLVGSNAYSEEALGFVSKAAQNIHIVTPQGLDGFKADLQNVDEWRAMRLFQSLPSTTQRR